MSLRPSHTTDALRRETAADVERFLAGGGKIERVDGDTVRTGLGG